MLLCSVQLAANQGETKEQRLRKAGAYLQLIAEGAQRPAQILFPELWGTGFFSFDNYLQEAEPETGDTFDLMSAWARTLNCYILTGSFVERDGSAYYNTNLLLNPNGGISGKYRKIHLFGYQSREAQLLTPGGQLSVVNTEYGRVGLCTCYDLRFPELFRALVNLGAEMFLVSSAWPLGRVEHWRLFNRARAIENQCALVSCNGAGTIDGCQLAGHSMAVEPDGAVAAETGELECIMNAEIDYSLIAQSRASFPALADKRLI